MTIYRGGIGQWSYLLHRITGVGVLAFLFIHILDTSLILLGPQWYNRVIRIYRHPFFVLLEIGLFAAVLYHALNGIRILLFDFWVTTTLYHRELFLAQMVIFFGIFLPVAGIMLGHILR